MVRFASWLGDITLDTAGRSGGESPKTAVGDFPLASKDYPSWPSWAVFRLPPNLCSETRIMSSKKKSYLFRLASPERWQEIEQAAGKAGMSINEWLNRIVEEALADEREQNREAATIASLEEQRDAKWNEIVSHLGAMSQDAAAKGENHFANLRSNGWNIGQLEHDEPNPDVRTGKGRVQLETEAERIYESYNGDCDGLESGDKLGVLMCQLGQIEEKIQVVRYGDDRQRFWQDVTGSSDDEDDLYDYIFPEDQSEEHDNEPGR
jgi:hypothetical protein